MKPFITQFRAMDADGSGRLEVRDLHLAKTKTPHEIGQIRKQLKLATKGGDDGNSVSSRQCAPAGSVVV